MRTHGEAPTAQAIADSEARFAPGSIDDPATLERLHASSGGFDFDPATVDAGIAVLLADAGLFSSRGEARRMIAGGGVTVNGVRVTDPDERAVPIAGQWLDVRIGKRRREIGRRRAGLAVPDPGDARVSAHGTALVIGSRSPRCDRSERRASR